MIHFLPLALLVLLFHLVQSDILVFVTFLYPLYMSSGRAYMMGQGTMHWRIGLKVENLQTSTRSQTLVSTEVKSMVKSNLVGLGINERLLGILVMSVYYTPSRSCVSCSVP